MSTDFMTIARAHWERYPVMEPQDFAKLAYQSEFGPAHMVRSPDKVLLALLEERKLSGTEPMAPEPIGNGLCRFHITQALSASWDLPMLERLFTRTVAESAGSEAGLAEKLEQLASLPVPGMGSYLEGWRREGCPPVRHSEAFRNAYAPHYRLLRMDYAGFLPALAGLERLARAGRPAIAAVDGRCGSGKTSLADLAEEIIPCQVVHMDDFYLPPERRAENWMDIPAGNMDLERVREEVLLPARAGKLECVRPYDCRAGRLRDPVELGGLPFTVVEGTYSQHPALAEIYDLNIFLTCEQEEQTRRLQAREGDYYPTFDRLWRTLEERYFAACGTEAAAGLVVDTTHFFA